MHSSWKTLGAQGLSRWVRSKPSGKRTMMTEIQRLSTFFVAKFVRYTLFSGGVVPCTPCNGTIQKPLIAQRHVHIWPVVQMPHDRPHHQQNYVQLQLEIREHLNVSAAVIQKPKQSVLRPESLQAVCDEEWKNLPDAWSLRHPRWHHPDAQIHHYKEAVKTNMSNSKDRSMIQSAKNN